MSAPHRHDELDDQRDSAGEHFLRAANRASRLEEAERLRAGGRPPRIPQVEEGPDMDDRRTEARRADDVTLARLEWELKRVQEDQARIRKEAEEEIEALRKEVDALKADREKAFRWGIGMLGSAVLVMAGWIWSLVSKKLGI